MERKIGMKIQDVQPGKHAFYYAWADEYENSEPVEAVITSGPYEVGGTLCCRIDIRSGVVALRNLSEERIEKRKMTSSKRQSKERYQRFLELDGCWTDDFGEYIRKGWYKELEKG